LRVTLDHRKHGKHAVTATCRVRAPAAITSCRVMIDRHPGRRVGSALVVAQRARQQIAVTVRTRRTGKHRAVRVRVRGRARETTTGRTLKTSRRIRLR
jgi:hypothetical protein